MFGPAGQFWLLESALRFFLIFQPPFYKVLSRSRDLSRAKLELRFGCNFNFQYIVIEKNTNIWGISGPFAWTWKTNKSNIIWGVVNRQHNSADHFLEYFEETIDRYSATGRTIYLLGDVNINILRSQTCN